MKIANQFLLEFEKTSKHNVNKKTVFDYRQSNPYHGLVDQFNFKPSDTYATGMKK